VIKRISPYLVVALTFAAIVLRCGDAAAQNRSFSFIRDAEIENTIRAFATPLFQVAGLNPSAVEVYIVNDNSLNAFVAGGQKLFINTGLLMSTDNPGQLIGVIAHETGHIAGGHLSQTQEQLSRSTAQQILATVVGAAAAVATGRGDVGAAVISGGQATATYSYLHYSRTQEGKADSAGMRFLDESGQSAEGMLQFLQKLSGQELLSWRHQDPYLRTHPLTRERILAVENHVKNSKYTGTPASPEFLEMHARMKAKLKAFVNPPSRTLREYEETDNSLAARYARAIAYYRVPDLDKALPIIDSLIADRPQDPYFKETKAQMLFENSRPKEALELYEAAAEMLPESALVRLETARVQLEMNDPSRLDAAIENLRAAQKKEPRSASIWRNLAIAYGRKGDMGMSALSQAEEAYARGNERDARFHASKAKDLLPAGSPAALQAADILTATEKAGEGKK